MLCNEFHKSTDYVFTRSGISQLIISSELDARVSPVLSGVDGECGDLMSRLLCHYFFAPCGANGQLHLPFSVCPDECDVVQSTCPNQWRTINNLLSLANLRTINCTTGSLLQGLAPCCIDAGIEIKCMIAIVILSTPHIPLSLSPSSLSLSFPIPPFLSCFPSPSPSPFFSLSLPSPFLSL